MSVKRGSTVYELLHSYHCHYHCHCSYDDDDDDDGGGDYYYYYCYYYFSYYYYLYYYYYYFNYFLFNIHTGSHCPGNKAFHNFSLDEKVIGS